MLIDLVIAEYTGVWLQGNRSALAKNNYGRDHCDYCTVRPWSVGLAETDPFGETAYLKVKRRVDLDAGTRATLRKRLEIHNPSRLMHSKPPECTMEQTTWKLKNFGMEMMRMWEDKCESSLNKEHDGWKEGDARGSTVLDELVENFYFGAEEGKADGNGCRKGCRKKMLSDLARSLLLKVMERGNDGTPGADKQVGPLRDIPLSRTADITLLAFRLYTNEGGDTDKDLGYE